MNRKNSIPVILAILVLVISSGFILKLDQSVPAVLAARVAPSARASHVISIRAAPVPVQILVALFVIFFGTLAVAPLLLEGRDARRAGILQNDPACENTDSDREPVHR